MGKWEWIALQKQTTSQNTKVVKTQKDRLGSAVVSLITGIASILFLFLGFALGESGMAFVILSFILSIVGLTLGIRARKSPNGRGMAIAGITSTVVPLILVSVVAILAVVLIAMVPN